MLQERQGLLTDNLSTIVQHNESTTTELPPPWILKGDGVHDMLKLQTAGKESSVLRPTTGYGDKIDVLELPAGR